MGKFEKPYSIINQSSRISTVKINQNKDFKQYDITIDMESASGGTGSIRQRAGEEATASNNAIVKLTSVDVQKGNFISQTDISNAAKSNKSILRNVEFPFRAILRISDIHVVEIEFFEKGNYTVDIRILD